MKNWLIIIVSLFLGLFIINSVNSAQSSIPNLNNQQSSNIPNLDINPRGSGSGSGGSGGNNSNVFLYLNGSNANQDINIGQEPYTFYNVTAKNFKTNEYGVTTDYGAFGIDSDYNDFSIFSPETMGFYLTQINTMWLWSDGLSTYFISDDVTPFNNNATDFGTPTRIWGTGYFNKLNATNICYSNGTNCASSGSGIQNNSYAYLTNLNVTNTQTQFANINDSLYMNNESTIIFKNNTGIINGYLLNAGTGFYLLDINGNCIAGYDSVAGNYCFGANGISYDLGPEAMTFGGQTNIFYGYVEHDSSTSFGGGTYGLYDNEYHTSIGMLDDTKIYLPDANSYENKAYLGQSSNDYGLFSYDSNLPIATIDTNFETIKYAQGNLYYTLSNNRITSLVNMTAPNLCDKNGTNCPKNFTSLGITNLGNNVNITLSSNITPLANNTYDLGSPIRQFKNIWSNKINATNVQARDYYNASGVKGQTVNIRIVCEVSALGTTFKNQTLTFTGGIMTSNTSCA